MRAALAVALILLARPALAAPDPAQPMIDGGAGAAVPAPAPADAKAADWQAEEPPLHGVPTLDVLVNGVKAASGAVVNVKRDTLVRIELKEGGGAVRAADRTLTISGIPEKSNIIVAGDRKMAVFVAPPGAYGLEAIVVGEFAGFVRCTCTVLIEDDKPPAPAAPTAAMGAPRAAPAGKAESVADLVRRWAAEAGADAQETRQVGAAVQRAVTGAESGLLTPATALSEARAMAMVAAQPSNGGDRWAPFFDKLESLWAKMDAEKVFQTPADRVGALKSVSQILLGRE